MSDETLAALDSAIRAHIADEHPGHLTASWVVICEHVPEHEDGMSHICDVVPDNQSTVTTIGLAHFIAQQRSTAIAEV